MNRQNNLKILGFILIGFLIAGTPLFGKQKEKKIILKPENISEVYKSTSKNTDSYYKFSRNSPLVYNLNGPGILVVESFRIFRKKDRKINSYSINFNIDGTAKRKRIVKITGSAQKKGQSLGSLEFGEKFSLKLGIGHHTIKFNSGSKDQSVFGKVSFIKKREKSREWQKITPFSKHKAVLLEILENVVKYYRMPVNKTIKLKIIGPGRIRFLTRLETKKHGKKLLKYKIFVRKGNMLIRSYNLSTSPSEIAFKKGSGSKISSIWKSRNISFLIPKGSHEYSFLISGSDIDSDFLLGRFVFSATKSKSKLKNYSLKKILISEEKKSRSDKKRNWKFFKIPNNTFQKIILSVKKRNRIYYRIKSGNVLKFNMKGSNDLKMILRVENTFKMHGRINFRFQLKQNGKLLNTYSFSSFPSRTVVYKYDKEKIPGTSRELSIKVPPGMHRFSLINTETDKNLLVRVLIKNRIIPKAGLKEKKVKYVSAGLPAKFKTDLIMVNKKNYRYINIPKGNSLKIFAKESATLKLLFRNSFGKRTIQDKTFGFYVRREKEVKKYTFKNLIAKTTFLNTDKQAKISEAVLIKISVPKKSGNIEIIPLQGKSSNLFLRIFVQNGEKVKLKRQKTKLKKIIPLLTRNQKVSKAANSKEKIIINRRILGRRIKNKKKMRIRVSVSSFNDSNILRYSPIYLDRFTNPLPKDEGRFNVRSTSDIVINPSIKFSFPINLINKLKSEVIANISFSGYISNKIKNRPNTSLSFDQQIAKNRSLRFSLGYIPDFYIRTYRDQDLVSDLGYIPDTFQSFDFSGIKASVRFEQKLLKDMKIHMTYSLLSLNYNKSFNEYDSTDQIVGIRIYKNIINTIRVNLGYRFRNSSAKGYDEPGETKLLSDDSDASYKQNDLLFGIKITLPDIMKIKNSLYFSIHRYRREYSTLSPAVEDPYHAGRIDHYNRLFINYALKLTKSISTTLFFNRNRRNSDRKFFYEKVDIASEKNYSQNILGMRLSLYLK